MLEHSTQDSVRRLLRIGSSLALVELRSIGTTSEPAVTARLLASDSEIAADALDSAARHWLHPDADLRHFYAFAREQPALWHIVGHLYGLRTLRTPTVFEALVTTIIEQQIALLAAQKAERWLCAAYGASLTHDGAAYYAFPTPERLASLRVDDLTPLKITFRRMGVILEVARAAAGSLDLEALRSLPPDEAQAALTHIKGVGRWTASWTVTRALGSFAYVGSADVALRAAVNRHIHNLPGRADPAAMDALFAGFGAYAGIAAYYTLMRYAIEKY